MEAPGADASRHLTRTCKQTTSFVPVIFLLFQPFQGHLLMLQEFARHLSRSDRSILSRDLDLWQVQELANVILRATVQLRIVSRLRLLHLQERPRTLCREMFDLTWGQGRLWLADTETRGLCGLARSMVRLRHVDGVT